MSALDHRGGGRDLRGGERPELQHGPVGGAEPSRPDRPEIHGTYYGIKRRGGKRKARAFKTTTGIGLPVVPEKHPGKCRSASGRHIVFVQQFGDAEAYVAADSKPCILGLAKVRDGGQRQDLLRGHIQRVNHYITVAVVPVQQANIHFLPPALDGQINGALAFGLPPARYPASGCIGFLQRPRVRGLVRPQADDRVVVGQGCVIRDVRRAADSHHIRRCRSRAPPISLRMIVHSQANSGSCRRRGWGYTHAHAGGDHYFPLHRKHG